MTSEDNVSLVPCYCVCCYYYFFQKNVITTIHFRFGFFDILDNQDLDESAYSADKNFLLRPGLCLFRISQKLHPIIVF